MNTETKIVDSFFLEYLTFNLIDFGFVHILIKYITTETAFWILALP